MPRNAAPALKKVAGGGGGTPTHFFHNGVGVLSASTYMTDL